MRTLVGVVVYDRVDTFSQWLRAYNNASHPEADLLVVQNDCPGVLQKLDTVIKAADPKLWLKRENKGRDIGALRDAIDIHLRNSDYDALYWSTDDALPMRRDFLTYFTEPLRNKYVGLVCNYLVPDGYYDNIPAHARTVSFALRKCCAESLSFPTKLTTLNDCWQFEFGSHNMMNQVIHGKPPYGCVAACGDNTRPHHACNDIVWDFGDIHGGVHWDWRKRQDHWAAFETQFAVDQNT